MTATNMCYNFVGFRYTPPLSGLFDLEFYQVISSITQISFEKLLHSQKYA